MTETDLNTLDDEAFEEAIGNVEEAVVTDVAVEEETEVIEEVIEDNSEQTETETEPEEVVETEDDIPADSETEEEEEEDDSHNGQEPQPEVEDTETVEDVVEPSKEVELDYKAMYEDMMGPVKVGGKEFKVKSVDDAKKLLGMGFSFSENMQGVKPLRAVGKTLESAGIIVNGVVDEVALTRLIDIQNGDKNALAQLMQEKEIDPLDVETEDISYTPTATMATEQSLAIEDVERELISRGSVDSVITQLDTLDDKSKEFFNESPQNLLALDDDIKSGVFDQVMQTVRYEKSLGRLSGVSDMEAYIQMVTTQQPAQQMTPEVKAEPKASSSRKKAAGLSKRAPVKKQTQPKHDLVNMSDEDFEKLAGMSEVVY